MWVERNIAGVCVGEDKSLDFEIYDLTNVPQTDAGFLTPEELETAIAAATAVLLDVSGFTFEWILRTSDKATGDPLLEKTSGAGISIVGTYHADPDVNTQRVRVQLDDTDTATADGSSVTLAAGNYRYALKRTDAGSETIYARGKFKLSEATAR